MEKRSPNQKYSEHEILVVDTRLGIVLAQGQAVVWDEVKAHERTSRSGTQKSKAVTVQIPKHLENYDKFLIILVPKS